MTIEFHGAAKTVTGSKHLIKVLENKQILLDCGMFQGLGRQTDVLNGTFGFDPKSITCVLLSHAHIDHSGLLPKLVREGFKGYIYCTQATLELTEVLLMDSAGIQEMDQQAGHDVLYTSEDVVATMQRFKTVDYNTWFELDDQVRVMFTPTGHLIGSAAIHLGIFVNGTGTTISYSADIGRAHHPLLRPADQFPQSEYLIVESTYGNRHHPLPASAVDTLLAHIRRTCIEKKGQLVIAAFSVGRTQELLFLLNQLELEKRLPAVPYYVDSPMGAKATLIMKKYTAEFNDALQKILEIDSDPFSFEGLRLVEQVEDSRKLVEFDQPCVIIASSGTGDAGRIRHHIGKKISNPANTILFSGYCGPRSTGGELLEGAKTVEYNHQTIDVRADIEQLPGMSAHGDADDICGYLRCQDPDSVRGVFLVHGEPSAQQALQTKLIQRNFYPVHIPEPHQSFKLNVAKARVSAMVDE